MLHGLRGVCSVPVLGGDRRYPLPTDVRPCRRSERPVCEGSFWPCSRPLRCAPSRRCATNLALQRGVSAALPRLAGAGAMFLEEGV